MVLSAERRTSNDEIPLGVVPWLQAVTATVPEALGASDSGPLTAEITRSCALPTPIRLPVRVLLVSISSSVELNGSTIAPTYQLPPGEEKALTARSRHSPDD